jgi:hypothetical protein
MDDRSSLDRLRGDLRRRGLPRSYIERVVGEMDDHRADLVAEGRGLGLDADGAGLSAAERLGHPERLADLVVAQYRRRTFLGRHPAFTFLVAPVLCTLAGWAFTLFAFIIPAAMLGETIVRQTSIATFEWLCRATNDVAWFVPPAAVMALCCRLAHRTGRGWPWLAASCAVMALLTGSFRSAQTLTPDGHGALSVGFGAPPHLLPMLLPVAIAAAFAWRFESSRRLAAA